MDIGVLIHPDQPEMIIIRKVENKEEGLRKVLSLCWNKFPGFFYEYPMAQGVFMYNDKYLFPGYPIVEEINWN